MSIPQVALGPEGAYYIQQKDGSQAYSGNLPGSLYNQLTSRHRELPPVDIVALGPAIEWFVQFENGKSVWGNASDEFNRAVHSAKIGCIERVVFGPHGTWFLTGSKGIAYLFYKKVG